MTTIACWASGSIRPSTARSVLGGGAPDAHGEAVRITAEQHGCTCSSTASPATTGYAGDQRLQRRLGAHQGQ